MALDQLKIKSSITGNNRKTDANKLTAMFDKKKTFYSPLQVKISGILPFIKIFRMVLFPKVYLFSVIDY